MGKREHEVVDLGDSDEDEDFGQPKKVKKAPATKKAPAAKRPAKKVAEEDQGKDDNSTAKKPRAKKAPAAKPEVDEADMSAWTCVPPNLIYRNFGSSASAKIAGFDLDGTLVKTKSGGDFARDSDDWVFFNPQVPAKLKELQDQGFRIVIFSNQGGVRSALEGKAASTVKGKIGKMLEKAGVPALVILATGKDALRKPGTGMWDLMCKDMNDGVEPDKSQSFFVGDAAGRPDDFMDKETGKPTETDKQFAANVGISFKVPEECFGEAKVAGAGPNSELINVFKELSDAAFKSGNDKDKFKALAFRKVVKALTDFEPKIDASNLKAVNALPGVGKGSMGVIKEYVETGKVKELEVIRGQQAAGSGDAAPAAQQAQGSSAPKSEAAAQALKFM